MAQVKINNWKQLDKRLGELAIAEANVRMANNLLKSLRDKQTELNTAIEAFIQEHVEDMGESKSHSCEAGVVTMRVSKWVDVKDNKECVHFLLDNGFEKCLKCEYKLSKTRIEELLSPEMLERAGIEIKSGEKVSIKLNSVSSPLTVAIA